MDEPKPGEKYRHFKGDRYEIITLARDTKNPNQIDVICGALDFAGNPKEGLPWRKSLEDFCGDRIFNKDETYYDKKYKKGDKVKRFTKI